MQYPVFPRHSDPRNHPPQFRANKTTCLGWVEFGFARMVGADLREGIILTGKKEASPALSAAELAAAIDDWRIFQMSHLPGEGYRLPSTQSLRITTRQLDT